MNDVVAPENDACGDVTAEALAVGGQLTFTGTTVGATNDGDYAAGSELEGEAPAVWHAFTTTECSSVTISYCGTTPAFGNVWVFLAPSCPAGDDYVLASSYDFALCDGNVTLFYNDLPAGTYYLPVMSDMALAFGEYTLEVSATPCLPYCASSFTIATDIEPICLVQFAGIDNTSCADVDCADALEDFTTTPAAQVSAGQTYPVVLSGNTAGAFTTYFTVFVDWDQDGTFEGVHEIGSINNTNCELQATGNITVPPTAPLGTTRMRVVKNFNTSPLDPCGTYSYGQAEDYTVEVVLADGIATLGTNSFNLFPNPTTGDITLGGVQAEGRVTVEVIDMTGRVVFREGRAATRGANITLPLAGKVAAGTYSVHLISDAGRAVRSVVVH